MIVSKRQQEIKSIHKEYKWFYPFAGGIIILVIGVFIGLNLFPNSTIDYSMNLYTEIISIIITLVILDRINEYRETQRLKKRLILQAGSHSNETVKSALTWLKAEGWLVKMDYYKM